MKIIKGNRKQKVKKIELMKVVINASNIHIGGGKTILADFLAAAKQFLDINFHIYIDPRFDESDFAASNILFEKIPISKRGLVFDKIEKITCKDDIIIYFGNLPPQSRHNSKVILLQSNRFLVDSFPLTGLTLKTKIRILIERFLFKRGIKNVDYLIVQSQSMADCIDKIHKHSEEPIVKVWPYKNIDEVKSNNSKDKSRFIYVASLEPYKNHLTLIDAWVLLKDLDINPKLYLTIDNDNFPNDYDYIEQKIKFHNLNISIKPRLSRDELMFYFSQSDCLIYPSFFESYGLPIVEAMQMNIPIIASELDFVRDLVDPEETFDPKSSKSISRAVIRFLGHQNKKTEVISGKSFIEKLLILD